MKQFFAEALVENKFILLWIWFAGGFPYPTVSNHELLNYLKAGERLERPENCSETLYALMLQCWATDPNDRPDFSDICHKLDPNKNKIYIDFSELSPNYVFPPTSEEIAVNEKLAKAWSTLRRNSTTHQILLVNHTWYKRMFQLRKEPLRNVTV